MLPLTQQEILKCYKPSEIFDTREWQELDPSTTNKGQPVKVLIARNIKHIRTLPRSVEVLISDSLEHLEDIFVPNLQYVSLNKVKKLNLSYRPKNLLWVSLKSLEVLDLAYIKSSYFIIDPHCKILIAGETVYSIKHKIIRNNDDPYVKMIQNMISLYNFDITDIDCKNDNIHDCEINRNGNIVFINIKKIIKSILEVIKQ